MGMFDFNDDYDCTGPTRRRPKPKPVKPPSRFVVKAFCCGVAGFLALAAFGAVVGPRKSPDGPPQAPLASKPEDAPTTPASFVDAPKASTWSKPQDKRTKSEEVHGYTTKTGKVVGGYSRRPAQ
jgi:hypothetical protein